MTNTTERRTATRVNCMGQTVSNDQIIEHSLIVDVNCMGAGLLVLKNLKPLANNICLKVLHPEFSKVESFDINADVIWTDENYSDDHRKVGIKFLNVNDELNRHIEQLMNWLSEKDHYFLHCEVIQL